MKNLKSVQFLIIPTCIALIFSLLTPAVAIADDATPPPPPATEEAVLIATTEPVLPGEDVLPPSDAQQNEEPTATEVPLSLPEILDQLPENTSVVVTVDDEIVPLATQQAANAFVAGDPIWCPDGVSPIANAGGCTDSYSDLFSLIDDIDSAIIPMPDADGVIWIMAGADVSSSDISIDGLDFPAWSSFQLTLQGGWDGSALGTIIGTSSFSVPLSIVNWGESIIINQISITGASGSGLEVQTSGDIELADVSSSANGGYGAELYSSAGSISLIGSNIFSGNTSTGLYVEADGDIDSENITANNNGGGGAELTALGGITFTGTNNIFNGNNETGLYVEATDDIDLANITADNNGAGGTGNGAELYSLNNSVTLTGVNEFNNNNDSGLYVESNVDVDVENVSASNNGNNGAEIYALNDVTLSGSNIFNNNINSGLYIEAGGDVDAENLTASGNDVNGAELFSSGDVTLSGINIFDSNNETGLYVEATTSIDAENMSANNNGAGGVLGNGVELYTSGNASLTDVNVFNNIENGLYIDAGGGIDLENLTANNNGLTGAELYSVLGASLVGSSLFNNLASGLYIESGGSVTAEDLTAQGNGSNGAELYTLGSFSLIGSNVFSDNTASGLYVESSGNINMENVTAENNGFSGAELYTLGAFTLSGANAFNGNFSDGLLVDSTGSVSIEYTDAYNNGGDGIFLETDSDATITCGILSGNSLYAIEADMPGTLTLAGVDFGGDIDTYLGADEDQLVLISNGCFVYPAVNNNDEEDNNEGGSDLGGSYEPTPIVLPVTSASQADGQLISLNCSVFSGTTVTLSNGDGAYIPCPILDSVRLVGIPDSSLPSLIPGIKQYISGFVLSVFRDGQMIGTPDRPATVEYVDATVGQNTDTEIVYWDGVEWSTLDSKTNPFINIFFSLPEQSVETEYAIMYWTGNEWVELTDSLHLGDERIVRRGGYIMEDGKSFGATVNFTGIFVLVAK